MDGFGWRIVLGLTFFMSVQVSGLVFSPAVTEAAAVNLTVADLPGENLTFLNIPEQYQAAGYTEIFTATDAEQWKRTNPIDFSGHFAKEATVTQAVFEPEQNEYLVYFTVKDTGENLAERTRNKQLQSMVLTDDLVNAKAEFVGKTIYPKVRTLEGVKHDISIPIQICSPVTVLDATLGTNAQEPIFLLVSADGQEGILPIAYSWTNTVAKYWPDTPAWQDYFFEENPRATFDWPTDVWQNIENGRVVETMTKAQILLSWGKPNRTENNDTAWIYGDKKVTFSNASTIETIESKSYKFKHLSE